MYGKQMENGSWDGIMGLMARGEADVTSVELTMEPKRSEMVDYIAPLLNDRYVGSTLLCRQANCE
jgi:molybdate-binding protein